MKHLKNLLKDESGATAIEYGLIAALLSVVVIVVLQAIGQNLLGAYTQVDTALGQATGG